ncbi:hypothetical protein Sjap_025527 [Stephania japonica]|uniref:Uncharacterized protein n=1 Tax=Stephania japonica TaxID=461633 RepID=A0AAP0E1Z5_9MAGN
MDEFQFQARSNCLIEFPSGVIKFIRRRLWCLKHHFKLPRTIPQSFSLREDEAVG